LNFTILEEVSDVVVAADDDVDVLVVVEGNDTVTTPVPAVDDD